MNKKIYHGSKFLEYVTPGEQSALDQPVMVMSDVKSEDHQLRKIVNRLNDAGDTGSIRVAGDDFGRFFNRLMKQYEFMEAAGGLIRKGERYLFIKRLGRWDLPKGKLDSGETAEKAAIRECEEECGISGLRILKKLDATYHIYPYYKDFVLKLTNWYLMETQFDGVLRPQKKENITEAVWFNRDEIQSVVMDDTYPALRELLVDSLVLN